MMKMQRTDQYLKGKSVLKNVNSGTFLEVTKCQNVSSCPKSLAEISFFTFTTVRGLEK